MKDLFVPYELAVRLKEKGFNQPCLAYFEGKNIDFAVSDGVGLNLLTIKNSEYDLSAPVWQQVIDWLRVEKRIYINIRQYPMISDYTHESRVAFDYQIYDFKKNKSTGISEDYNSYYSALQSGIEKALELI